METRGRILRVLCAQHSSGPLLSWGCRYTCLIATPCHLPRQEETCAEGASSRGGREPGSEAENGPWQGDVPPIVGVVDATRAEETSVLRHLPEGITAYLYLTGMAVDPDFR